MPTHSIKRVIGIFNSRNNIFSFPIAIFIFFFSCYTQPVRQEIEVGKTIKIESSNFPFNEAYTYLWSKPFGPDNHNSSYTVDENKMLFTPNISGNYNITLLVESYDKTKLYEENFLYICQLP